MHELAKALRPVWDGQKNHWEQSEAFKLLKKLHKIRFEIAYRNKVVDKEYKVKSFTFDEKYGGEGAHAKSVKFEKKMPDGTPREYSIAEYYKEMYNITLKYPLFPLIQTNRDGCFPIELCRVKKWNPYPFKLDPEQTSEMIKFAVQRPPQRKKDIQKMVQLLKWDDDKFLTSFGLRMNPTMPQVQAMVLRNPEIEFRDKKKINPGVSGRWDLRGHKFVKPNQQPLKSWAFVITDGCVDKPTVENFIKVFSQTYQSHGGIIAAAPQIYEFPPKKPQPELIAEAYLKCGKQTQMSPQLMFVILKDKIGWIYERMKKNLDCRWACLSQMVQAHHVKKAQAQYCSNVAMKVNAKLGGQTSRIHAPPGKSAFFSAPTMMIGVDVSHPSPGSLLASMAAMAVSMDKDAAVYAAGVESNGYRTEVLSGHNTHKLLGPIVKRWVALNKCEPQHVFYFRDGVSEGQFAQVMEYELGELKVMFKNNLGGKCPKITVIICTKRHHIRFFPMNDGDRNGNPLPGTLVEREVTHPFHYDFYLCSHVAIQGTARPVHYQVIHDEIKMKPDDLQKMIYQQCYQYCRSTTPVSLHPAVYYAHLACNRARHHENVPTSEQVPKSIRPQILPKRGIMAKVDPDENTIKRYATPMPLMPMGGSEAKEDAKKIFPWTMWYV
ncbi:Piwi domain-containing protein [Diplogelasinospora grovesii]|uniref:Piwi domain-containing protein n=1 Tax=Diplogelasinospora grovesii TaxID=303347 RepID=A0AAN6NC16_9PEZI|nr:Piwi domain-containing protein [Diplogelasinospora grovesii]